MRSKWDKHYKRNKSVLLYPDENLVRMLQRYLRMTGENRSLKAVDLGCGSGRHLKLLSESGISTVIGIDNSFNALRICRDNYNSCLLQSDNRNIPLQNNSADIVIAWGSLHYNHKKELPPMIDEIYRIMRPEGVFLATLRSDNDTVMKKGVHIENNVWQTDLNDIEGSIVSFYSEKELTFHFSGFPGMQYGIMERSLPGDIGKRISHWVIFAEKE